MGEENKIYVGGLATETTSDSLRAHFSQFGEITDCIVMPDKLTGRSRCFGFISFKDLSAMNAALGTSNLVDGREVSCKKAVRENPALAGQGGQGPYNTVKIFVGGLPASCDYDKFTAYFARFGRIEDAVVLMDNLTQRHRGFGYVTYSEGAAVEAALQNYAANQIDGKWIEVKRCIPQDKMAPGSSCKGGKGKPSGKAGKGPAEAAFGPSAGYAGSGSREAYGAYGAACGAAPAGQPFRDFGAPPGGDAYAAGHGAYGTSAYGGAYGGYGGAYAGAAAYGAYGAYPAYPAYGYGAGAPRYGYRPGPY